MSLIHDIKSHFNFFVVPLEEAEKKARKASVEDKIKKEFSLDYIDKDDPDPKMLKRLEYLEKNSG